MGLPSPSKRPRTSNLWGLNMGVLNLKLMANPLNWVTLALWFFVAAMVLAASGVTLAPPSNPSQPQTQ